jgi:lipid-binding SYLF domain-containing protein
MQQLLSSKFQLGADASAAAGPVGWHADGNKDSKMWAEVLSYSRARGIFAGISLDGAVIKQDNNETKALYGTATSFRSILKGQVAAPNGFQPFLTAIKKHAEQAKKAEVSERKVVKRLPPFLFFACYFIS